MSADRIPTILRVEATRTLYVPHHAEAITPSLGDVLSTALGPGGPVRLDVDASEVAAIETKLCAVIPSPRGRGLFSGSAGDGHLAPTPLHVAVVAGVAGEAEPEVARVVRRDEALSGLALLAAAGDQVALDRLLTMVRPTVVRYCRARMGRSGVGLQQAEDVAQNVLLAVCGAIPRYRSGQTRVMAFVYGIASNKVVDAFRAAGRDHSDPTDSLPETADTTAGPESAALQREQVAELWTLLDLLPAAQREVLVMRVAMGLSAEETALDIGSTAGAVRVTQHRALAKLRGLLADDRRTTSPRFDL